jgi:hypothetical protein
MNEGIRLRSETVFIAEVGSTAHGMSIADQDDLDLTLVRIEPWIEFVNGPSSRQSMMVRTQPDGARSGPGDLDINVYTLRKYVMLLASGNPSILGAAYSPTKWLISNLDPDWSLLFTYTTSKKAGRAYLGYMKQQLERWQGKRGQKNVNRPELVEKYGYDTKYAGHIIRLGIQGRQYLTDGFLSLPLDYEDAELIKSVRRGEITQEDALQLARDVEAELEDALDWNELPQKPNMDGIYMWLADVYREAYGRTQ